MNNLPAIHLSDGSHDKVDLQVVEQTIEVGAQTAANLKGQVSKC